MWKSSAWALVVFLLSTGAWAGPVAVIEHLEVDLGRVERGSFVEYPIRVENRGDAPLEIQRIQSSCPCAQVDPLAEDDRWIAPGGFRDLVLRYEPDDREGPSAASIVIYTNDPDNPVFIVDARVFVDVLVSVRPAEGVFWGMIPRGQPIDADLTLMPGMEGVSFELVNVRIDDPALTYHIERDVHDDRPRVRLHFSIRPDAPIGLMEARADIRVRVGTQIADIAVPLRGNIIGDLLLTPPAIISPRTVYPQGTRISEITVQSSLGGPPPDVVGVMAVGPLRAVVEKGVDRGRKHQVVVFAGDNAPSGPQSGTIFVMTTSKDQPIVAVPVFARMAAPVVIVPDYVVVSESEDRETGRPVEVRNLLHHRLTIQNVRFEPDVVEVEVLRATQETENEPALVVIRPAATVDPDKRATMVVIETDGRGAAQVPLPAMVVP